MGAFAACQDLRAAVEPPTEHSLIIKVLPGVGAVEGPDTNIRDVRWFHHPGVYGDAVVTVFVSAFIMRQTPTTFAVKEFERLVLPPIRGDGIRLTANLRVVFRAICPACGVAATKGAGAPSHGSWFPRDFNRHGTAMAGCFQHG